VSTPSRRALVVFESMFGNTERVAAAVADGLRAAGVAVDLREVGQAPAALPRGLDLLVVGGPTHGFTMSRPSTRADAVRQGAPADRAPAGVREWLSGVALGPGRPPAVATFDTRVAKVRWLPMAAGPAAHRAAGRRGLEPVAQPVGFVVDDVRGPLLPREVDRAEAWGHDLATAVTALTAPGAAAGDG
jgi:hypothetical protein